MVFNPYVNSSEVIPTPGLTNYGHFSSSDYRLAGVNFDRYSQKMFVAAASSSACNSIRNYTHANYTGPNRILEFDPVRQSFTSDADLSPAQQAYFEKTGYRTSGFRNLAETIDGSVYAIATFGNSIVKICEKTGLPQLWYTPDVYNRTYGFGGIFAAGDKLVISDNFSGGMLKFDTQATTPHPEFVPLQNLPPN